MNAYTVKNLKDIEDAARKFGMPEGIEARFARQALGGSVVGLSYHRLGPNVRQPFGHRHEHQEEVYVLLSGSARIKVDDDIVELAQWYAIRVDKDTMRQFEAGDEGAEFLAFGAPVQPEPDWEIVPGWWSD